MNSQTLPPKKQQNGKCAPHRNLRGAQNRSEFGVARVRFYRLIAVDSLSESQ